MSDVAQCPAFRCVRGKRGRDRLTLATTLVSGGTLLTPEEVEFESQAVSHSFK